MATVMAKSGIDQPEHDEEAVLLVYDVARDVERQIVRQAYGRRAAGPRRRERARALDDQAETGEERV
jgi:hypothetical protein